MSDKYFVLKYFLYVSLQTCFQGCDLSGFFLISGFFVTKISVILLIFSPILCVLDQFTLFFRIFYYSQDFS